MKITTFNVNSVKLIVDDLEIDQLAASASISLNPNVTWLKLVLTDDKPNANRQRIPKEEYANVLRTGAFMPLKMAYHEISEGHEGTYPLGVLAHLKTEGESIHALAALWDRERNTDVEYLTKRYKEGQPIDISWELTYTEDQIEEDGVTALRGVAMNAATIVSMPAYEGRTPVIAISSTSSSNEGDTDTMDTIELTEHQRLLDEQKVSYEKQLQELTSSLESVKTELAELQPKYNDVLSFKTEVEAERAKAEKLVSIKTKFNEAGLNVSEEYFSEREQAFLAMSGEQIDFFVQELIAAFSDKSAGESSASVSITSKTKIPALNVPAEDIKTSDIIEYLRTQK